MTKAGGSIAIFAALVVFPTLFGGCGRGGDTNVPIENLLPDGPAAASFGPLYPQILRRLAEDPPNTAGALADTRAWAESRLAGFEQGACARAQVVSDSDFSVVFGRTTLGVTLPWMQIFIRDGRRTTGSFLWKDASLFVSTVLHEFVHARQRSLQAATRGMAGDGHCLSARGALEWRRRIWDTGFEQLRGAGRLTSAIGPGESALLWRWVSPIERAKDEVEASAQTVQWMSDHEGELNAMTIGGANNWAYAAVYLEQLKALATSRCFSPDDETYAEELRIYDEEVPRLVRELEKHEAGMRAILQRHNVSLLRMTLDDMLVKPQPSGRDGSRCENASALRLPRFPTVQGGYVELRPLFFD
jgi:hypothetical protein